MQAKNYVNIKLASKILNLKTNKHIKEFELQHGTCFVFTGNCNQKFAIEFEPPPSEDVFKLFIVMKQYDVSDFTKVGKTPSFGGMNLKAPIFKTNNLITP